MEKSILSPDASVLSDDEDDDAGGFVLSLDPLGGLLPGVESDAEQEAKMDATIAPATITLHFSAIFIRNPSFLLISTYSRCNIKLQIQQKEVLQVTVKDILDFLDEHPELLDEALAFLKKRKAEQLKNESVTSSL